MWTVVYIALNQVMAEQYKALLEMEGIMVMLRPMGVPQMGFSAPVEILVAASEAEEAAEILTSSLGR